MENADNLKNLTVVKAPKRDGKDFRYVDVINHQVALYGAMIVVKFEQRVSFPHKKGEAVGGGIFWKNCLKPSVLSEVFSSLVPLRLKPSGSVFWKKVAPSTAYLKKEEGSVLERKMKKVPMVT